MAENINRKLGSVWGGDSYEVSNDVCRIMPKPVVSIVTITYNHAKYIRDCIEGVLMQQTDFSFEFIIGEDCSTDGTREIVFEYAQRFPSVIRLITAGHNIGMNANWLRCYEGVRGQYVAFCEGDDRWTDPLKLQRQVDTLRAHPECTVCLHAAESEHQETGKTGLIAPRKGSGPISVASLIDLDASSYATASIMLRSLSFGSDDILAKLYGRHSMVILYAAHGGVYYIDESMCEYRVAVPGSWGSRNKSLDSAKQHAIRMASVFSVLEQYTKGRFRKPMRRQQMLRLLSYLAAYGDQTPFDSQDRRVIAECLPAGCRGVLTVCCHFPRLAGVTLKIWRKTEEIHSSMKNLVKEK
jgi:glycosyltransferase involved in cell wall biosynthesis